MLRFHPHSDVADLPVYYYGVDGPDVEILTFNEVAQRHGMWDYHLDTARLIAQISKKDYKWKVHVNHSAYIYTQTEIGGVDYHPTNIPQPDTYDGTQRTIVGGSASSYGNNFLSWDIAFHTEVYYPNIPQQLLQGNGIYSGHFPAVAAAVTEAYRTENVTYLDEPLTDLIVISPNYKSLIAQPSEDPPSKQAQIMSGLLYWSNMRSDIELGYEEPQHLFWCSNDCNIVPFIISRYYDVEPEHTDHRIISGYYKSWLAPRISWTIDLRQFHDGLFPQNNFPSFPDLQVALPYGGLARIQPPYDGTYPAYLSTGCSARYNLDTPRELADIVTVTPDPFGNLMTQHSKVFTNGGEVFASVVYVPS